MPPLTQVGTELTTAVTDALLGLLCIVLTVALAVVPTPAVWKRNVWVAVLLCMAAGSLLGAAAHGLDLSGRFRAFLWKPLYLSLGLAVALVVVGAAYDAWGEQTARQWLPWALAAGVGFFAVSQWFAGAFAVFIVFEAAATLGALAIYGALAARGTLPGAPLVVAGLILSLVAAVVQVSPLSIRAPVRLDHNGLFHLVQMIAVAAMAAGIRAGLR